MSSEPAQPKPLMTSRPLSTPATTVEGASPPPTPDSVAPPPSEPVTVADDSVPCEWDACGVRFTDLSALVDHIHNQHIGLHKSSYSCEWTSCSRRGLPQTSRFALISHMRLHTGEKPFTCTLPECDKSFTRSDALAKHMRQQHNIEPPLPGRGGSRKRKRNPGEDGLDGAAAGAGAQGAGSGATVAGGSSFNTFKIEPTIIMHNPAVHQEDAAVFVDSNNNNANPSGRTRRNHQQNHQYQHQQQQQQEQQQQQQQPTHQSVIHPQEHFQTQYHHQHQERHVPVDPAEASSSRMTITTMNLNAGMNGAQHHHPHTIRQHTSDSQSLTPVPAEDEDEDYPPMTPSDLPPRLLHHYDPDTGLVMGRTPAMIMYLIMKAKFQWASQQNAELEEELRMLKSEKEHERELKEEALDRFLRSQFGEEANKIIPQPPPVPRYDNPRGEPWSSPNESRTVYSYGSPQPHGPPSHYQHDPLHHRDRERSHSHHSSQPPYHARDPYRNDLPPNGHGSSRTFERERPMEVA